MVNYPNRRRHSITRAGRVFMGAGTVSPAPTPYANIGPLLALPVKQERVLRVCRRGCRHSRGSTFPKAIPRSGRTHLRMFAAHCEARRSHRPVRRVAGGTESSRSFEGRSDREESSIATSVSSAKDSCDDGQEALHGPGASHVRVKSIASRAAAATG